LTREPFLIEELRTKLQLPSTKNAEAHLAERKKKREEIPLDFYSTDAMLNRNWTNANQRLRHVVIKLAVHGYHHKICLITNQVKAACERYGTSSVIYITSQDVKTTISLYVTIAKAKIMNYVMHIRALFC
jgi:hypothetical protein